MIIGRVLLYAFTRTQVFSYAQSQLLQKQDLKLFVRTCNLSSHHVSKNIEHIKQSNNTSTCTQIKRNLKNAEVRPLLVLLSWLLAKHGHIMKFANLYLEQGFDIVVVSLTPWQLMWPTKGSRIVAADLLEFLMHHQNYRQILLHGFSVGGYMWGEVLDLILCDRQKYDNIIQRVIGQVWDSAADVSELTIGTTRAVFPNNEMLQNMLQKYLEYHLKTFYEQSTQYYIRSSQLFHMNLVRGPALFFMSKTDLVGTVESNLRIRDKWNSLGVKTHVKIFEKSLHVGHYRMYPKEYVTELYAFLHKLDLIQNEEKMRSRL